MVENGRYEIVKLTINNEIYKCWRIELIRPYIIKFLKEKFPDCLMTFETNRIDIVVFDKNDDIIPVEIQRIYPSSCGVSHTDFENRIRRQLEDNVENYDKYWLFFDYEYLRYLQSGNVEKSASINMNWLVKYMIEDKIKVYAIRYDGMVKELSTKDFDFLINISVTCPLGYDNDDRVLNRNKLKIFRDILRYYGFIQDDIEQIYFNNNKINREKLEMFSRRQKDKRIKTFGNILHALGRLPSINNFLDMNVIDNNQYKLGKWDASFLGIFELEGDSYKSSVRFFDKADVCKYFPGYLRYEDTWNKLKGHKENIVTKKTNINKGIDYFWYEKDLSNAKVESEEDK